jgi:alpha-tubulin suppressor-like RCC1 family protein
MRYYNERLVAFVGLVTTAILVACGSSSGSTTGPSTGGTPTNIVKVSGDSQSGSYEATIPNPLVVKVTDSVGQPVTNTPVSWLTTLFGGTQQQNITTTNAGGKTQYAPVLGGLPGVYVVTAAINGHSVTFSGTSYVTLANGPANLSAGLFASCGLTAQGAAYCWGNSVGGLLGNGSTTSHTGPVPVSGGHTFTHISVGALDACGVATGGALYCWGDPNYGSFGNGSAPGGSAVTTPASAGNGMTFSSISVGWGNFCGMSNGAAYCWGNNSNGADGTGDTIHRWSPAKVLVPSGVTLKSVSAGSGYACGLSTTGTAYCWGSNYNGTLGMGSSTPAHIDSMRPVAGGQVFTSLAVGTIAVCGLTGSGTVYCWGEGVNGNGTTATEYAPTAVQMSGQTFTQVSMLGPHACGLTASGAAYCWGENTHGALGSGSFTTTGTTMNQVVGGLTFSTIMGGGTTTCGYTTKNAMYCWGDNTALQLGLSPTADSMYAAPQVVPGLGGGA